jgi:hypothetical protein
MKQFSQHKKLMKTAFIINVVFTIAIIALIIFSALYFIFNPEIIGDFFGKIANGFINAKN